MAFVWFRTIVGRMSIPSAYAPKEFFGNSARDQVSHDYGGSVTFRSARTQASYARRPMNLVATHKYTMSLCDRLAANRQASKLAAYFEREGFSH